MGMKYTVSVRPVVWLVCSVPSIRFCCPPASSHFSSSMSSLWFYPCYILIFILLPYKCTILIVAASTPSPPLDSLPKPVLLAPLSVCQCVAQYLQRVNRGDKLEWDGGKCIYLRVGKFVLDYEWRWENVCVFVGECMLIQKSCKN